MKLHHKKSAGVIISSALLIGLFFLTLYQFRTQARIIINQVIATDVALLKTIFDRINTDCAIIGFDHEKNYIDFLTIKSFVSSEVGAMNLMVPEKWAGPYAQDNPTIQSKKYEIVHTKTGYYIVPGTGVQLSNGMVMGKDIVITSATDIDDIANEEHGLFYQGKALVAPVTLHKKALVADIEQEDE
jgi:hypothetical protein